MTFIFSKQDKIYPKKFNLLMSDCLEKAKGNLCERKIFDPVMKCVIRNMVIHVTEAKTMYNKNQAAVAKLADNAFVSLPHNPFIATITKLLFYLI